MDSSCGRGVLGALVCCGLIVILAPEAGASYALQDWNMEARRNAPLLMKAWLGAMLLANLASVFFVRRHVPARWVLGAFVVSHVWIGLIEATGIFTVQGGLVSLGHIVVWAPAIYALLGSGTQIRERSPFGLWAGCMLFFYGVSLVFDVRDAFIWVGAQIA